MVLLKVTSASSQSHKIVSFSVDWDTVMAVFEFLDLDRPAPIPPKNWKCVGVDRGIRYPDAEFDHCDFGRPLAHLTDGVEQPYILINFDARIHRATLYLL